MVEKLRNREEWILFTIIMVFSVSVLGVIATAFGVDGGANQLTAIGAMAAPTLTGLFAALKVDKSESKTGENISSAVSILSSTTTPTGVDVAPVAPAKAARRKAKRRTAQ